MRPKRAQPPRSRSSQTPAAGRRPSRPPPPLDGALADGRSLLAAAQKVVDRLSGDLRRVVRQLPESACSMYGMSRFLGIDRNVCQRVLLVAKSSSPGPELLAKSPGIDGLMAFADSLRDAGVDNSAVTSLEQAIGEFQSLIERSGRSQAALARRIRQAQRSELSSQSGDSALDRSLRESMYRGIAEWCGESTDCALHVFIANRSPDGPEMMDAVMVNGLIGYTARHPATPLTITADASHKQTFETIEGRPLLERGTQTILWPFTTPNLGVVTHSVSDSGLLTVIDPALVSEGRKVDYVTAMRPVSAAPNTLLTPPYEHDNAIRVRRPARHLLLDVFMHRDLIPRARPGVGTFFPGLRWPTPRSEWWSLRLPQHAGLELVGENLGPLRTDAYPRHEELIRSLFASLGWPLRQFIGHRLSVPFPVWGTEYRIWFDGEG